MTTVWEIIADYSQLPRWRVDVKAVSLLSTNAAGVGVRRRITPVKGQRDFIEEFKAWYNGFGYEYSIVDTKKYSYNLFRIRLQATPDGTIVQWTTEFQVRGFIAALFGLRRRRRQLNRQMIGSLRELRRYVVAKGVPIDDNYRTKMGVQQAPDVDHRVEYGAQLFEQVEQRKQQPETTAEPAIEEPPVRVEDTPSVPRVAPPSFVTSNFDVKEEVTPPPKEEDTRPSAPIIITEEPARTVVTGQTGEMIPPSATKEEKKPAADDIVEPLVEKRDTDSMSIWEVFGIERPQDIGEPTPAPSLTTPEDEPAPPAESDTRSETPVSVDELLAMEEPPIPSSASVTAKSYVRPTTSQLIVTTGLRKKSRRKRLRVRLPRPFANDNSEALKKSK
ncbi:MAG: SRPBCC family protein [Chloroflexi bacterium]|nr:SRPBCC family protein [Chloroflexota bacterium]